MRCQLLKHFVTFANFTTPNRAYKLLAKKLISNAFCLITGTALLLQLPAAYSKVTRLDEVDLGEKHYNYLYQWYDPDLKPKAIVIAIHGLTLHGKVYDQLAYHLAQEGIVVLAPDLPGYGRRWHKDSLSYVKAEENVIDIIQAAKAVYKDVPLICMGESMGANLALAAAQSQPNLVDGLILSSPALETRVNITPKTTVGGMTLLVSLIDSNAIVDLAPYMRNYASEDPIITQSMLTDPLVHKQLKGQYIWECFQGMRPVYKQARLISKTTPVLIMQGKMDKILNANAIIKLVSSLNSDDQTVKWFKSRGHTMLEECQPKADILATIDDWFRLHIDKQIFETKTNTAVLPVTSSLPPFTQAILNTNTNSD